MFSQRDRYRESIAPNSTTSVHGGTLRRQVGDIVADFERDGVGKIVFFNGHFENEYPIREAIDRHVENGSEASFLITSWWDLLSPAVRDRVFSEIPGGFPGWEKEHAGTVETSLMWYFRPDLVREEAIVDDAAAREPPYTIKPAPDETIPDSGVLSRASDADAGIGKWVANDVIEATIDAIRTEWG